jgi:hypothetical protein
MHFSNLYPAPRSVFENSAERFTFGGHVTAAVSGLNALEAECARYLWYRFSCDACELTLTQGGEGFTFSIGNATCALEDGDSYALRVTAAGACVVGRDGEGLLNGIKTLVQLICPVELAEGRESFYMTAAEVHDAPEMGLRAIHICVFPSTTLYQLEQAIHLAGFLKLTHVILEFWGTFRYECQPALYWHDRSFSKEELRPLVELVKGYGMELIPMVNHFGHAPQSRARNGRHVVLNQNPRLSRLFEPDGWTWCLSNPDTYKLLADMRAELDEWAGAGKYFHLGFDEADSFATCDLCRERVPHELLTEFVNRLTEDVCKTGRRPILWHDMFLSHEGLPTPPQGSYTVANGRMKDCYKALDSLDRRLIMADWQYGYHQGFNPSTAYFIEKGFDTVVCPWDDHENIRSLAVDAKKYGAMGMILTTWHHPENFLQNAAFWGNCAWSAGERPFGTQRMENAGLLRRLRDAKGSFEESGWGFCEVEK